MSARPRPVRRRYEKGFWAWAERQVILLQESPERRAFAFQTAWWISIAFIGVGVAYIWRALFGGS